MKKRYLIVGNSAAGVAAAKSIRRVDEGGEIMLVGDEPYPYYARVLTSYYMGGLVAWEKLWLVDENWYQEHKIKLMTGCRVTRIDSSQKKAYLDDGREIDYDRLLIATGSSPQQVEFAGEVPPGVFTLRTLEDVASIRRYTQHGGHAVIVGGGLVGIKAAEGLHALGMKVHIVVSSGRVLSQVLDNTGAGLVHRVLVEEGFDVRLRDNVVALEGREKVTGVILNSGSKLPADVVIVAKGVQPNVDLLQGCDVEINRGVVVNDYLATSNPDIFAAGDVAEAYDRAWRDRRINAIWVNAVEQGRLAGLNMTGRNISYYGGIGENSLVMSGLGVISGGIFNPPRDGYRVVTRLDEERLYYRKAVLHDNCLAGVVAIGPPGGVGSFLSLIGRQVKEEYVKSFLDGNFSFAMLTKY